MKQHRLARPGSIDGLDAVEVPTPTPGPGEALVRIRAASLNYRDTMTALGIDEGINYRDTPGWDEAARAMTGGAGVDHVVEVGGAGTLARSLGAVRMGGSVAVIGVLTGRAEIDPTAILRRRVALRGIYVGSRAMFEAMNRAILLHRIRPAIDRVFAFEEARAAWRHMEGAGHFGKIVVRI